MRLRTVKAGVTTCRTVVTVDYDIPEKLLPYADVFIEYARLRAVKLGATSTYCKPSPSGRGLHCTVCFPMELSEEERLALEAALMDDPKRILFNLRRLFSTGKLLDILFSLKEKLSRPTL